MDHDLAREQAKDIAFGRTVTLAMEAVCEKCGGTKGAYGTCPSTFHTPRAARPSPGQGGLLPGEAVRAAAVDWPEVVITLVEANARLSETIAAQADQIVSLSKRECAKAT